MKILFIRHGQTQYNAELRWLGSTDNPLCEAGKKELLEKKHIIKKYKPVQKLYCSPMKRCVETAEIYFDGMNLEIMENLRERCFGDFEGKKYEELKDNPYYKEFNKKLWRSNIPNGEDYKHFFERAEKAYLNIIEDMKKNNLNYVGILSHGGIIMYILSEYDNKKMSFYDYLVKNGSGFLTEVDEKNNIHILEKF